MTDDKQADPIIIRECMYCKKRIGCINLSGQNTCITCSFLLCFVVFVDQHDVSHGICSEYYPEVLQDTFAFVKNNPLL